MWTEVRLWLTHVLCFGALKNEWINENVYLMVSAFLCPPADTKAHFRASYFAARLSFISFFKNLFMFHIVCHRFQRFGGILDIDSLLIKLKRCGLICSFFLESGKKEHSAGSKSHGLSRNYFCITNTGKMSPKPMQKRRKTWKPLIDCIFCDGNGWFMGTPTLDWTMYQHTGTHQ